MRIAIDARTLSLSTGRYVSNLIDQLQKIDSSNEYVILLLRKDFEKWEPVAANFRKVVADYPIYSLSEQLGFARMLYGLRADLVHFAMPQHPLLYFRKHVVTIHDLTLIDFVNKRDEGGLKGFYRNTVKPLVFKVLMKWTAVFATAIITPTDYVREQVAGRLGARADKVFRTYEAADRLVAARDARDARQPEFIGGDEQFLLFVGNAYPYKNLSRLIEAFDRMGRRDLKLVLVGKTDYFYEQLRRETERKGIKGVIFTGFVGDEELSWLYEHARAYVFPSASEGFGLPGLEAMQYDLPVVAADASCLPEVYREAAMYFDSRSAEDLAGKIAAVLDDERERLRLTNAGRKLLKKYSWKTMAKETLAVYERAGDKR